MPRPTDPVASSVWVRQQPSRRGEAGLSQDQIVTAAVELLDAEGLSGLSMRRLGTRLGSAATSAYWHVRNKDELLELAYDQVMGEIDTTTDSPWRAAAATATRDFRAVLVRHPWALSVLGVVLSIGPNSMRLSNRMIGVLAGAGFSGADLTYASSALASHAIGSATATVAMHATTARTGMSADAIFAEIQPYIAALGPEYDAITDWSQPAATPSMATMHEEAFEYGLERLLDGLTLRRDRDS